MSRLLVNCGNALYHKPWENTGQESETQTVPKAPTPAGPRDEMRAVAARRQAGALRSSRGCRRRGRRLCEVGGEGAGKAIPTALVSVSSHATHTHRQSAGPRTPFPQPRHPETSALGTDVLGAGEMSRVCVPLGSQPDRACPGGLHTRCNADSSPSGSVTRGEVQGLPPTPGFLHP